MKRCIFYLPVLLILFPYLMKGQITVGDSTSSGIQFYQVYKNLSYQISPYASIDIDNDQVPDIKIEGASKYIMGGSVYAFQSNVYKLDSVDIVATTTYTNWADSMQVGALIDSTLNWQRPANSFCIRSFNGGPFPSSCGIFNTTINSGSFIGFRKKSSNVYGWINISPYYYSPTSLVGITLRSYAVFGLQTSVKENSNNTAIHLYPNPTNSLLTIKFPEELDKATLSIKTILGQTIALPDFNKNTTSVDVGFLANGVYLIELSTEKGTFVKKFTVNR